MQQHRSSARFSTALCKPHLCPPGDGGELIRQGVQAVAEAIKLMQHIPFLWKEEGLSAAKALQS